MYFLSNMAILGIWCICVSFQGCKTLFSRMDENPIVSSPFGKVDVEQYPSKKRDIHRKKKGQGCSTKNPPVSFATNLSWRSRSEIWEIPLVLKKTTEPLFRASLAKNRRCRRIFAKIKSMKVEDFCVSRYGCVNPKIGGFYPQNGWWKLL